MRRAIQLGLRGNALCRFGEREILSIEDITLFVAEQRQHLPDHFEALAVPEERVYLPR
jgi:hypothetical protein